MAMTDRREHAAISPHQIKAILSLGQDQFSSSLIDLVDRLIGVDLCSAFVVERPGRLRFLFASTRDHGNQEFAERASLRYAQEFWRHDPSMASRVATEWNEFNSVIQQSGSAIKNLEYRQSCYEDPNVVDRVSVLGIANSTAVLVSVYRRLDRGCFKHEEVRSLQLAADVIVAMTAKHASLRAALTSLHPPINELAEQLSRLGANLSHRERQICAAVLAGKAVKDIAREQSIQISTVVTYKKRAFLKLRIETRRDLARIYNAAMSH